MVDAEEDSLLKRRSIVVMTSFRKPAVVFELAEDASGTLLACLVGLIGSLAAGVLVPIPWPEGSALDRVMTIGMDISSIMHYRRCKETADAAFLLNVHSTLCFEPTISYRAEADPGALRPAFVTSML